MTEQEKIDMQRESFILGASWAANFWIGRIPSPARVKSQASMSYPDPAKPREVEVCGWPYRVVGNEIQTRLQSGAWVRSIAVNAEMIRALHDLLENPMTSSPQD